MTIKFLAKTMGIWLLVMMFSVMTIMPLQYSDFMKEHNSVGCDIWAITSTCDINNEFENQTSDCRHLKVVCQSLEDESSIARILAIWYFISWFIIIVLASLYMKRYGK